MNIIKLISHVPSRDEEIDGYYLEPSVTEVKTWSGLTTPHGYLRFKGEHPRVWLLNLHMWIYYRLPYTWKHD